MGRASTGRVLLASSLIALTAGCGMFGPGTDQTDHDTTAENAANAALGTLRIDDAYAQLTGADVVQLHFTLNNDGSTADRLVSVSTGSGLPKGTDPLPLELAPGAFVDLDNAQGALTLTGLTPPPPAGSDLSVTFRFAQAGATTLALPVVDKTP